MTTRAVGTRAALATLLAAGSAVITFGAASDVGAVDTLTVVTGDENPTPAQVAAGEPSSGWNIGRDPANVTPFEFTTDESSIGDGALYVGPIGNDIKGNADKFISEYVLGIPTADFESISYDILVDTATPVADANEFYLNIYTSLPETDGNYDPFYNCRFDVVPSTASDTAFTTISLAATDAPSAVVARSGATCPPNIAGMPADSTLSFVSLNVGDTSAADQDVAGYFDNVVIAAAGDTETFDFEAPPTVPGGNLTLTEVTEDENPTAEQRAAFEPSSGWDIGRDPANLAPFAFTTDESSIGDGALYAGPIGNDIKGNADKFISEYVIGQPTSAFQSISYDILVDTATPATDANEFYMNVYTNMPGSTDFYECRWNVVPQTASNTSFTTVSVSSGDTTANPGLSVTPRGGASCPTSIGAMPAGSTISFISISVGDTSANDQDVAGFYDNVVIRTNGNIDVFDFEAPEPKPITDTTRKVVEDEDDLFGWDIATGTGFETDFAFNDDVASIGAGALLVGPINNDINGPQDKFISSHIIDVLTSHFESFSYDLQVGDVNDANEFYLNIYTNMPGSTAFYECRFDVVPGPGDVSTTAFSTIEILAADTTADPLISVTPRDGATCPTSIAGMPAGSTVSFVSLNGGDTSAADQGATAYFDNVVIASGGSTETFDFDVDEPPVFPTQPDDVEVETAPGGTDAIVDFPTPVATDDLSVPTVDCVPASGSTFPVGVTEVTCTATDSAAQTAETTFDVTVVAVAAVDAPPMFDETPADVEVATAPGETDAVVEFDDPAASDDNGVPTVECVPASGSTFPVGTTEVTCTATDSIGQTAETTFDVTVTATPQDLVAIDPARLLDTRSGPGEVTIDGVSQGGGALAADGMIEVDIAGRGGVPADAIGAVLNLAGVGPDGPGFATLYPCSDTPPNAASLNMTAGVNISNATFVDLSDAGSVCVFTSVGADFTLDVVGYLPASSRLGLVDPARLLETRNGPGEMTIDGISEGDGPITAGNTIEVQIAGRGGVDGDAVAAMVNVAAIQATDVGFITLYPCGAPLPLAASLNYTPGTNISNATLVELSPTGQLCVFAEDTVDVTIDVVGFAPPGTDVGTLVPARLLETRSGPGFETIDGTSEAGGIVTAGTSIEIPIAGRGGVDTDATSAVLNLAGVNPAGPGFATLYPCTDTPPTAASLNVTAGVNISNATLVDLSDTGTVCLFTSVDAHYVIDAVAFDQA